MEETAFSLEAEKALNILLEFAEDLEQKHDVYAELEAGVLTVNMPDDRQYVINKHTPSKQIWVSSPYSGAGYYEFVGGRWLPKRSQNAAEQDLFEFVKNEVVCNIDKE